MEEEHGGGEDGRIVFAKTEGAGNVDGRRLPEETAADDGAGTGEAERHTVGKVCSMAEVCSGEGAEERDSGMDGERPGMGSAEGDGVGESSGSHSGAYWGGRDGPAAYAAWQACCSW